MEALTRRTWLRALAVAWACAIPGAGRRPRAVAGLLEVTRPAGAGANARLEVWRGGPRGWEHLVAGAVRQMPGGWSVAGLAPGPLAVRVTWAPSRGRRVVADERVELGRRGARARPRVAPRTTRVTSTLVERSGREVAATRALARPVTQVCRLACARGAGPPFDVVLAVGEALHVRGLDAVGASRARAPGPRDAAPGWALRAGPRRAVRRQSALAFVDEVARTTPVEVAVTGVPADATRVLLHARSDDWCAAPATLDPTTLARTGRWRGALALALGSSAAPSEWQVLARALDAEGRATHAGDATVGGPRPGSRRRDPLEVALARGASLEVVGPPSARPGDLVRARLAGWTLDLAAVPLGRDRRARLVGLVAGRDHDVQCGAREERVRAPGPGRTARVLLGRQPAGAR